MAEHRRTWHPRRLIATVPLACSLLGLSGCWDAIPVEQRAIVTAIAIDQGQKPTDLIWSFVLPNVTATATNLSSVAPSQQFYLVEAHAQTWSAAQAALSARLSRLPYFGQLEAVALDERLPTQSVAPILADINVQTSTPKSFFLVGAEGRAATLVSTVLPDEVVPRYWLKSYFACQVCHPTALGEYGWQWWTDFEAGGHSPVIPVFRLVQHTPQLAGLDVYREEGPPVRMPDRAADGFALLTGRVRALSWTTSLGRRTVKVERVSTGASTAASETPSGVLARVRIQAVGTIAGPLPSENPAGFLRGAETLMAESLLGDAREAIMFSNQTHTDPFGWNERAGLMAKHPKGWPETPPIPLHLLAALVSVKVHLVEEGVYGG